MDQQHPKNQTHQTQPTQSVNQAQASPKISLANREYYGNLYRRQYSPITDIRQFAQLEVSRFSSEEKQIYDAFVAQYELTATGVVPQERLEFDIASTKFHCNRKLITRNTLPQNVSEASPSNTPSASTQQKSKGKSNGR